MAEYQVVAPKVRGGYIQIQSAHEVGQVDPSTFILSLPCWRPGRYERVTYARFIRGIAFYNESGKKLNFTKLNEWTWLIDFNGAKNVHAKYEFWAGVFNAGGSYHTHDLLYLNPANLFLFEPGKEDKECTLRIDAPGEARVTSLLKVEDYFIAKDFHELADSPIIISSIFQHSSYQVKGVTYNIWWYSPLYPAPDLNEELRKVTESILQIFGDAPFKEYHFMMMLDSVAMHHGVEHAGSTVIVMGPAFDFTSGIKEECFPSRYLELVSIMGHELFHSWNVKAIRPKSMLPYDYTQPQYCYDHFITEGITTYYGEYLMLKAGVTHIDDYMNECLLFEWSKHLKNAGRRVQSLLSSSIDSWVDGYGPVAPDRTISFYTKGCIAGFIIDIEIINASGGVKSLDNVMKRLYIEFSKAGKGYDLCDFKTLCEQESGAVLTSWDQLLSGFAIRELFEDALDKIGGALDKKPAPWYTRYLGIRFSAITGLEQVVEYVHRGSPAFEAGVLAGDSLMAVQYDDQTGWQDGTIALNSIIVKRPNKVILEVSRRGALVGLILAVGNSKKVYGSTFTWRAIETPSPIQKRNYDFWSKKEISATDELL